MNTSSRESTDDGFTLIELLVSMALLVIVAGIATVATTSLLKTVTKENGYVDAQAGVRKAFETMDRQVTYADAITTPALLSGNQWINWQVPDPTITPTAPQIAERCYQWEATSTGTLQYRSWIATTGTVSPTPSWVLVLTGLLPSSTPVFSTSAASLEATPFGLPSPQPSAAAGISQNQQVGVSLNVSRNTPAGSSAVTSVFTALNSTTVAPSSSVCSQVPEA
jgi:prepilin-type N-terminal cleavage/methylation domain-containing protein